MTHQPRRGRGVGSLQQQSTLDVLPPARPQQACSGPSDGQPGSSTQSTRSGSSDSSSATGAAKASMSPETRGLSSCTSLASSQPPSRADLVLGKFSIVGRKVLGEGASSICYLGTDIETGEKVAVKAYKHPKMMEVAKFRRQVEVLLELQQPFQRPAGTGALWARELDSTDPCDLFVKLLDFSKDAKGRPGQDPTDGTMYVVTELADVTLKDMLRQRHKKGAALPADQVLQFAKEIMLAVTGLHAKGFVHMDIKPENIMMCKGRWKLIDMDGCMRVGTVLKRNDQSVSFSPCYCAPEFARFVTHGGRLVVSPSLDVWSVGMTIGELVNLIPLLRSRYQEISEGRSSREASMFFLHWLGDLEAAPVPRSWPNDCHMRALLRLWMLVPDPARRKSLVESLSAPYFASQGDIAAPAAV